MYYIYTDGASRGNPGDSAYGFAILKDDDILSKGNGYLGEKTNNQAEYIALLEGLKKLLELDINKNVIIYMDSQLIVRQIKGVYKIRNKKLKEYYKKIVKLLDKIENWNIKHINREENEIADKLANDAIDSYLERSNG